MPNSIDELSISVLCRASSAFPDDLTSFLPSAPFTSPPPLVYHSIFHFLSAPASGFPVVPLAVTVFMLLSLWCPSSCPPTSLTVNLVCPSV